MVKINQSEKGDGAQVVANRNTDPWNLSRCNSMCPKCCHPQKHGLKQAQAFGNSDCKWLIFFEKNCDYKLNITCSVRPSFLPSVDTNTNNKKLCEAQPREEGHVSALTL